MNKKTLIIVFVALIIGIGLGYYSRHQNWNTQPLATPQTNQPQQQQAATTPPTQTSMIRVSSPTPNQIVTSPLLVTGEARGTWFFEASFPVKLVDANGKLLTSAPAQAQGDWMTTDFVPFQVQLQFTKPTTATGTLILEKDNPSGLPQNADELRIPVRFQ